MQTPRVNIVTSKNTKVANSGNHNRPNTIHATALRGRLDEEFLNVGIIGAGVFGSFHAEKYHTLENVMLAGVFDKDVDAAIALAEKFQTNSFNKLSDLIEICDAVIITTPAKTHAEIAITALKSGCHVFIEKPIALSLAQADEIINEAEKRGLLIQVGHQERYVADVLGIFSIPEMPTRIECQRCMPVTGRGEDVSVVMDMMIHDLDMLLQFSKSGLPVVDLQGNAPQNCHEVSAEMSFPDDNLTALCVASRRSENRKRCMTLEFGEGNIDLDFLTRKITNTTPYPLKGDVDFQKSPKSNLALTDPLGFGARAFVNAVKYKTPPQIDGHAGRAALSLALRIEGLISK